MGASRTLYNPGWERGSTFSMKNVHRSVLIWYSAEEMFGLVTDIARYPEFLPWCDHAAILESEPDGVKAEVGIAFGGIRQTFTTRNHHVPGREVKMKLVDGPFSQLDGRWLFTPLGQQAGERACKVGLDLHYTFKSATLATLVGPAFDKIAGNLVDAFVKRAEQIFSA